MVRRNIKNYKTIILAIVLTLSLFTIILIIFDPERPKYYNLLWSLPLIFSLFFILILEKFNNFRYRLSAGLVISIYGFRMIIVPLIMRFGNYSTYGLIPIFEKNMGLAIILLCWEFIVISIFIVTQFWKPGNYSLQKEQFIEPELSNKIEKIPFVFKVILLLLIFYMVFIFIGTPGLIKESFFFTTGRTEQSSELYFSGQVSHNAYGLGIGSQLVTISFTVFWILQAILPAFLISQIMLKIKSIRIRSLMVLLTIVATLLITTEGRAHSIESAVALMISTKVVYKNKVKLNIKPLIFIVACVILFGLMNKTGISSSSSEIGEEFSTMVSAYFSGPQNVATAIETGKNSSELGIWTIITDFILKLPYVSQLFTGFFSGNSSSFFNQYFGGPNLGQILPSIGMGYIYFGFLFAPVIPCLAVWITMKFEKKAKSTPDLIRKNLYYLGMIMLARTTATSNMLSGVTYLGNIFFTWVLLYISFYRKNHIRMVTLNEKQKQCE